MDNVYIQKRTLRTGIDFSFEGYEMYAFPGRKVSRENRAEHFFLPLLYNLLWK